MAKVRRGESERIYAIRRWLGVNEAEEGEASLKMGEAAVCRNFRVTEGGALRKRGGSRTVAGLLSTYTAAASDEEALLFSEEGVSDYEIALYPRIAADSVGNAAPEGTPCDCTGKAEADACAGYYGAVDGEVYRFARCVYHEPEAAGDVNGTGSRWRLGREDGSFSNNFVMFSDFPTFTDGAWDVSSGVLTDSRHAVNADQEGYVVGKYVIPAAYVTGYQAPPMGGSTDVDSYTPYYNTDGVVLYVTGIGSFTSSGGIEYTTLIGKLYRQPTWDWYFNPVTVTSSAKTDTEVKALWSGFVDGREVLCAACNGMLWELTLSGGEWSKVACGAVNTEGSVFLFGFEGKLYILNGSEYKVWDGTAMASVTGYRPLVAVAVPPEGGGELMEQVNKLTGARRAWFSPDGETAAFTLPESGLVSVDWVKNLVTGETVTGFTADLENGTVTLSAAPERGIDTLEIAWTFPENSRGEVEAMRFAEVFNGAQDTRVFLYGDGSNECFYSGIDHDGKARADYFPDLNECAVGEANTPITAMIRHYNKLMCFKEDSAWSIAHDTITLTDGTVTAGFYVTPVNRSIGCCAYGEARLVENRPRTLDGRSVIEWRSASGGTITGDERNAVGVSGRVGRSIMSFDLTRARTYYDKTAHEYYVIGEDGCALVESLTADAWYVYTGFCARCLMRYKDEVYFGTADGELRHFSEEYTSDEGEVIDAVWQSGAMDFSEDFRRKYSARLWVTLKPEENAALEVSAETDRESEKAACAVKTGAADALPRAAGVRLRVRKFGSYRLTLRNNASDGTALILSADLRVRGAGFMR